MASCKILFLFLYLSFLSFATTRATVSNGHVNAHPDGDGGHRGAVLVVDGHVFKPADGHVLKPTIATDYLHKNCSENGTIAGSTFQSNLKTLLSSLSSSAAMGFHETSVRGKNPSEDSVFGLFMCRGDVSPEQCQECVQDATYQLTEECSSFQQAVIWYGQCTVRYSNRPFFFTANTGPGYSLTNPANITTNEQTFMLLLFSTMNKTADEASAHPDGVKKFATRQANVSESSQRLYCLAQCTPDLKPDDCRICLDQAIGNISGCCGGRQGGRVLYPSCNVRYELIPFYSSNSNDSSSTTHIPASNFSIADSHSSQDPTYLSHNCSNDNVTTNSAYIKTLLSYMYSNATKSYYKDIVEETVYGLFMCRGDLPSRLCQLCVRNATDRINSLCNSSQEAIIWYSHCMLRYSSHYFFSQVEKSPTFQMLNVTINTSSPIPNQDYFTFKVSTTLASLGEATGDKPQKYLTISLPLNNQQTLYTLGQCTQDLSSDDCNGCLADIYGNIPWSSMGSVGGRVLYPSCNLRFELFQFYMLDDDKAQPPKSGNHSSPSVPKVKEKGHSRTMILIIVFTIISVALFSFGYYLIKRKTRKSVKTILRENFGQESVALKPLQFSLDAIKAATNNFSTENRIGKGGFGEVYKGKLFDGREIAIKRLSISSRQGENEFKNEVLSIAKLQHRNLVAFIGFGLEEKEKVLIYEYVPNKSLDYFLFDSQQSKLLRWSERYNIIGGIALGIHYLHEHSRLKIIHRDLKPSNILLYENMIPKISDFGLAKIIEINQDQGSTVRIAGTPGYMSPEYVFNGYFSEKSDVFSFGVMVLEIITGKRNSSSYGLRRYADDLLRCVWRQWSDQTPLQHVLAPSIESFSEIEEIEVHRCIQIALLSVQPNFNARPTMAEIVWYLNNSIELPSPQEPTIFLQERPVDPQSINEMSMSESLAR